MAPAHRMLLLGSVFLFSACGPSQEDREALAAEQRALAAADTLAQAEAVFAAEAFDTVRWVAVDSAVARGQTVFSYSCQKCHGDAGDGSGGFVAQGDTLRPPSFLTDEWPFRDDHEGLRHQIFVGTASGMPHWGLEGLKPRDIDAVAHFIRLGLRDGAP
ncbi:MAG: cytochrome c [Gemmatimonadetes bacterium]|nr:cytochrome c [Gemmatimonadota bacterium]